ncbi:hypothetical protein [Shimia sp. Alg240-R146]|uniref:hypothetical protein n=1 Tax=Shimia sp. Alg240-R146 TaxID=2993449 RepID=UPI0022E639DD|nr:hypothetical protein [Shimia sp. Alg240-R146]
MAFSETQLQELLTAGSSAKGMPAMSLIEVEGIVPLLHDRGFVVQSMEAYEIVERGERHPLNLDVSLLGLEAKEEQLAAKTKTGNAEIVFDKIARARKTGREFELVLWIDDMEDK